MQNEGVIRFGIFSGVLIVMAVWESLAPRRERVASRWWRSVNNLLLVMVASLLVRVMPALSAIAAAEWATQSGFGLLHLWTGGDWLKGLLAVIALDLLVYGQHVATHRLPMLWRFHRVHHTDLDLDATSGVRFHPIEILLSMGIKVIAVVLLGVAAEAVLIFEILLNATSVFNHANVRIPIRWDWFLRWFIVTPDMHRVHHSVRRDETDSNYGFNLPWWDRLFGTYRAQPRDAHENLILGVPELRTAPETVPLLTMLAMPLQKSVKRNETPIDRSPAMTDSSSTP